MAADQFDRNRVIIATVAAGFSSMIQWPEFGNDVRR